jgi:hypothetical protein
MGPLLYFAVGSESISAVPQLVDCFSEDAGNRMPASFRLPVDPAFRILDDGCESYMELLQQVHDLTAYIALEIRLSLKI